MWYIHTHRVYTPLTTHATIVDNIIYQASFKMSTGSSAECGFCLRQDEALEEPKLLPCGHVHCLPCLTGARETRKIVQCPDCQ